MNLEQGRRNNPDIEMPPRSPLEGWSTLHSHSSLNERPTLSATSERVLMTDRTTFVSGCSQPKLHNRASDSKRLVDAIVAMIDVLWFDPHSDLASKLQSGPKSLDLPPPRADTGSDRCWGEQ